MRNLSHTSAYPMSPLRMTIVLAATMATIGLLLMFSLLLLVPVLITGAMVWVYLWWKTRHLRKLLHRYSAGSTAFEGRMTQGEVIRGEVIEGEVIRENDAGDGR